jgi:hypothetical protein
MLSPLYGQLSPLRVPTMAGVNAAQIAADYIAAVESADGQPLESAVKTAYQNFISGCVSDGLWLALKSSCILAGARTLSGALVPLVGTAPTNNNFVTADFNRKTGLIGNSTTKYLNTNRPSNSDPQNNCHISIYQNATSSGTKTWIGHYQATPFVQSDLLTSGGLVYSRLNSSSTGTTTASATALGFYGASRSFAASFSFKRPNTAETTITRSSATPSSLNNYVFASNNDGVLSNVHGARLSFFSIGESLNLTLFNTRVSNLMTALAAAIP